MSKTTIKAVVQRVFEEKRQNAIYIHQFIRVAEIGTQNIFDVQFYNAKIKVLKDAEIKEGDQVLIEANVNGKFWEKEDKSGIFLKINGQSISKL